MYMNMRHIFRIYHSYKGVAQDLLKKYLLNLVIYLTMIYRYCTDWVLDTGT